MRGIIQPTRNKQPSPGAASGGLVARSTLARKALLRSGAAAVILCAAAGASPARAEDAGAVKFSGLIDTGIDANASGSTINAGRLFTDKADQWVLNQTLLTAEKDLDPKATGYDWGFKLQGLYGTDGRYTHFIGLFDHNTGNREQFDITEANLLVHTPWLTEGGTDWKIGGYTTPIGYEVIQANNNPLYSHSYIFNYALPLKHAGVLTTTHVTPMLDLWLGVDSGLNTTYGQRGNPNGAMSAIVGLGFNLDGGKLTILALSHLGPTDAELRTTQPNGTAGASHKGKYINDIVTTYKPDDKWTVVNEINYTRDDLLNAYAFGIAQYGIYQLTPTVALVARGEIFADPKGAFVTSFQGNNDPVNAERGLPTQQALLGGVHTTYGALTLGANIKLPDMPQALDGAMIRPEIRWDQSLNGNDAFNYTKDGTPRDAGQFTAGLDVVIPVSF